MRSRPGLLLILALEACGRLEYQSASGSDGNAEDGGPDAQAGALDAASLDGGHVVAPLTVTNLRAEWETPTTIRWRWDRSGDAADFGSFELVIGPTEADVEGRTALARVFDASENPELGVFTLPGTGDMDPVVSTITDGLTPDTAYYAQLVALRPGGLRSSTPIAAGRTLAAASSALDLFDEAGSLGFSIPATFELSDDRPLEGSGCYRYVSDCAGMPDPCWQHLRRHGLNVDASSVAAAAFNRAFLEIAVASDAREHTYYGAFRLQVGMDGSTALFQIEGLTIRADGEYRVYEIPLTALGGMAHADLQRGVYEVGVGGAWSGGAIVRVDRARVRW